MPAPGPLHRLMPTVLDVPLVPLATSGAPVVLADLAAGQRAIALHGAPGSGRSIALQQLAATAGARAAMLLDLASLDDGRTSPAEQLRAFIAHQPALILIDGIEDLPPARRTEWAALLQRRPAGMPALVVALPADEPAWAGYAQLALPAPDRSVRARWLTVLLPRADTSALQAALAPGGALATLGASLEGVALAALVAARGPLPVRPQVVRERALAIILAAARFGDIGQGLAELELLAGTGRAPARPPAGLTARSRSGRVMLAHPWLRRYLRARFLVRSGDLSQLTRLDPHERQALVLPVAGLLTDVEPLLALLWGGGEQPAPADLALLAAVLIEAGPAAAPAWRRRLLAALGAMHAHPAASTTLALLAPSVQPAGDLLAAMRCAEPGDAAALIGGLLADAALPAQDRWAAADALLALPATAREPVLDMLPPGLPRAYILANAGAAGQARLAHGSLPALQALAGDPAIGPERRQRTARALLAAPAGASELRAAAALLLDGAADPDAAGQIEALLRDPDACVRRAARTRLASHMPRRAAQLLMRVILDPQAQPVTRLLVLDDLAGMPGELVAAHLARAMLSPALPLVARLAAVNHLARRGAHPYLARLAGPASPVLRVAQLAALAAGGQADTLAALQELATAPPAEVTDLPVRDAAVAALGHLGPAACPALLALLARDPGDTALRCHVARALGRIGSPVALPALRQLLTDGGLADARAAWTARSACTLDAPPSAWLADPGLPLAWQAALSGALTDGLTEADRPSTASEYLVRATAAVSGAAARALAAIGGPDAVAAMADAVAAGPPALASNDLLAALGDAGGADQLQAVILAPTTSTAMCWAAVRALERVPGGGVALASLLDQAGLDLFVRGAVAEALGRAAPPGASRRLRAIAASLELPGHLRRCALAGLAYLADPASEPVLLQLITDSQVDAELRARAADALPGAPSAAALQLLRRLAEDRPEVGLHAAVLRALGRAGDREALPLLVRFCQDGEPAVAEAALDALGALADPELAPVAARVVHSALAAPAVRVRAAGLQFRLAGEAQLPPLRAALMSGPLPLRQLALEQLLAVPTPTAVPALLLADRAQPLALRMLIATAPQAQIPAGAWLAIAQDGEDAETVRLAAVRALGVHADAVALLGRLANDPHVSMALRRACIRTLASCPTPAALLELDQLAAEAVPALVRTWALDVLLEFGTAAGAASSAGLEEARDDSCQSARDR